MYDVALVKGAVPFMLHMNIRCKAVVQPFSVLLLIFVFLAPVSVSAEELREIDWLELMPAEDVHLLENMPEVNHDGEGAPLLPDEIMTGRTVPEMEGQSGRIPGFVVPLKTTDDMRILEFFLVPYYGACIHVPPPPPNQIIHVKYEEGFKLEALYDPVWIEGTLRIERTENDVASSSYSLVANNVKPYEQ